MTTPGEFKPWMAKYIPFPARVAGAPAPAPAPPPPDPPAVPEQGSPSTTLQDSDLLALTQGNVIPFLTTMIEHGAREIMAGGPQRSDYASQFDYETAQAEYVASAPQQQLQNWFTLLGQAQDLAGGQLKLGDGTVITTDMLNSPDPAVATQMKQAWDNRNKALLQGYNDAVTKAGMDQWKINTDTVAIGNDARQATFTNSVTAARENMNWDTLNLSQASDAINRELSGMQESRQRADLKAQSALKAAPYATGGKTDFTGADFGGLGVEAARMAGLQPNDVAIRFPSTVTIDPGADMAAMDARLGVGQGPLPSVPMIAPRPTFSQPVMQGAPAPPMLATPVQPTYAPPPAAAPPMLAQRPMTPEEIARAEAAAGFYH